MTSILCLSWCLSWYPSWIYPHVHLAPTLCLLTALLLSFAKAQLAASSVNTVLGGTLLTDLLQWALGPWLKGCCSSWVTAQQERTGRGAAPDPSLQLQSTFLHPHSQALHTQGSVCPQDEMPGRGPGRPESEVLLLCGRPFSGGLA